MALCYLFLLLLLGVYSYSQIDLNLTLFRHPLFLTFQHSLITLGYFNRPLSAFVFLFLIVSLSICYFPLVTKMPSTRNFVQLIAGICILTLLSYPAFSHDIFNYLFDARILLKYGQNPYLHKALDFPGDDWLRFLQWTHRTYPYGPLWLLISSLPSYFGFGKFILTLLNFKLLFIAIYLGSLYLLSEIAKKINPSKRNYVVAFYALNPLVVIESLLSPHIDSLMTIFVLLFLFFFTRKTLSAFALIMGGAVKFLPFILLPLVFGKQNFSKTVNLSIILLSLSLVPVIFLRELYPWYFLPLIALLALKANQFWFKFSLALSLGLVLRYAPFIYFGNYFPPTYLAQNILTILPFIPFVLCLRK